MDITGKWFMNPGDIPAPFVYPVVLHADGVAEWLGGQRGKQPWRLVGGNTLMIGDGVRQQVIFDVARAGSDWLSGVIRSYLTLDADDLEAEEEVPSFVDDAALLLRDPGDFEILQDSAERLREIEEERAAQRARAFAEHGEWGQLGLAIL